MAECDVTGAMMIGSLLGAAAVVIGGALGGYLAKKAGLL